MSQSPPVIAQIVQHLAPGGIETMVLDLQKQASDPELVHIISLEGSYDEAVTHWPRIQNTPGLHFLEKAPGLRPRAVSALAALLKELNIDVVHTHHAGPLLYGGLAAKLAGCHHVHTEHDAWHLHNFKRRCLVGSVFHLLRPTVVADADLVAGNIREYIPLSKPVVILNGIDTVRFIPGNKDKSRQQLGLPADVKIIGCAARFTAVKSHNHLIHAFSGLSEDTHLALAGGGELEQPLRALAESLNISDRVHFLNVIEDMPAFYRAIDIFCLASEREGLPLSPLEAQSCGKPVVLTNVGGCREAVDPNSGLLVSHGNIPELTKALEQVLETSLTDHAKDSARKFVLTHGDLKRMIQQYENLYQGKAL